MTSPFATPASASGIDYKDLNGSLLLVEPTAFESGINTSLGVKDAVRGNITVLDGTNAGTVHEDVLIFPRVLIGQLRTRVGQKVLGRLGQGVAKPGQSAPWMLQEATPADQAIGLAYLQQNTLAQPAAAQPPF